MKLASLVAFLGIFTGCGACSSSPSTPQPGVDAGAAAPAKDAAAENTKDAAADTSAANECEAKGGACTMVGACNAGQGFIGSYDCAQGGSVACCFAKCGGDDNFACCQNGAEFRPVCQDGNLTCLPGQTKGKKGGC